MATRFHVTLEDHQYRQLRRESERSSLTMAELVRRALDKAYGSNEERRIPGVELSVGLWRRPDAALVGRRAGIRFDR
jgi:hypothetical protein